MPPSPLHVLGRFPPPLDGQTVATQRLADLLTDAFEVHRTTVSAPEEAAASEVRLRPERVLHYLGARGRVRRALASAPSAPVLWTSISPAPLGHARDLLTVRPTFQRDQDVYAVVHRGDFERLFASPLTRTTAQALVRRLRAVVFLTEQLAQRCAPWIPDAQRAVVPNTISADLLCTPDEVTAKRTRRSERTTLRLLFLSNMIPEKGYTDVLEAVARIHARGLPLRIDFAGRWAADTDREAFERFVAERDLGRVVTHHGGISDRTEVRRLYLAADLFLLPTYYPTEAQPLSILEALNAGTPVVATAWAGIPEMIEDGREGLPIPPRDPDALADAVERLADVATWSGFSDRARARFETTFSPDVVRERWLDLLAPDSISLA